MLGRIRPSPCSPPLECLELEMPPSKIVKHDSLSIYEATLAKLKQGSKCSLSSPDEALDMGADCTSASVPGSPLHSLRSASNDAVIFEKDHLNGNALKGSLNSSLQGEDEMFRDSDCSSASISPSSSLQQQKGKNLSIIYMFSKYNSSRQTQGQGSPQNEAMILEQSSSTTISSQTESTTGSN